jgi:hypothetical protein
VLFALLTELSASTNRQPTRLPNTQAHQVTRFKQKKDSPRLGQDALANGIPHDGFAYAEQYGTAPECPFTPDDRGRSYATEVPWKKFQIKDTSKQPMVWKSKGASFYLKPTGLPTWAHRLTVTHHKAP